MRSELEIRKLFRERPEWVDFSGEIASGLGFSLAELNYRFPCSLEPGESADQKLRRLTYSGLTERYPLGVPDSVTKQVEKELGLIAEIEVAPYFLSTWEVVDIARQKRILCQGRGSAANKRRLLRARHHGRRSGACSNLLFERFLCSVEAGEPPDIDIDFEHERREEVIQAILRALRSRPGGHGLGGDLLPRKSALREVGKVFDLPLEQVDRLSSTITH